MTAGYLKLLSILLFLLAVRCSAAAKSVNEYLDLMSAERTLHFIRKLYLEGFHH